MIRNLGIQLRNLLNSNLIKNNIEFPFIANSNSSNFMPIFIVGAPRSGTTLVYQALINQIHFSFFTNWVNILPSCPVWVSTKFSNKLGDNRVNSFKSNYGLIKGINSPSEAGLVFREWFEEFEQEKYKEEIIRKSINTISNNNKSPFICKNVYNSLRLEKINKVIENFIVIHVQRDIVYNAQSVINARKNINGNIDEWWGPLSYLSKFKQFNAYELVLFQIKFINESIENQIKKIGKKVKYITVTYEDFCHNSNEFIEGLKLDYETINSTKLIRKNSDNLNFTSSNFKQLPDTEWSDLSDAYKKHSPIFP